MLAGARSDVDVRPFRAEDAPGRIALARLLNPGNVATPRGLLHAIETEPERAQSRLWTAEAGEEIVGSAAAHFAWWTERDDLAELWVGVRGDLRGRGVGARLYELAAGHLTGNGARELRTWVAGDEAGARFVEARGFAPRRSTQLWSVDPRTIDVSGLPGLERERAEEGFSVVPVRAVRDREPELHALHLEAAADEPSDHTETNVAFDEWKRGLLEHPDFSLDGSFVVLAGERPVSFAFLGVDLEGGRASHWMTGTLRDYRRRGLARLAKLATARWAAEHGITAVYTGNDSTNADMLTLNDHLGYRPTVTATTYAKTL